MSEPTPEDPNVPDAVPDLPDDLDALLQEAAVLVDDGPLLPFVDVADTEPDGPALLAAAATPLLTPSQAVRRALYQVVHPTTSWDNLCDRFVGYCYGRDHSGYVSAQAHWDSVPAQYKHSGIPPAGGAAYWRIGTFGHTALSVGGGLIASNDIVHAGRISIVGIGRPASDWGAHYLGWADPYYQGQVVKISVATPTPPPVTKPRVSLANVAAAARHDPLPSVPTGSGLHKPDVLPVEKALARLGYLPAAYVDGTFGTKTVEAYARWQRALGYSGADADGIPGRTSLTRLGARFGFTVV